jgi:hypothetical protein
MEEPTQTSRNDLDTGTRVGRQQAFAVIANKCSAAQALSLKQMKDTCCHEQLGLSWDDFCDRYIGLSRRHVDRVISQYNQFGEAYFRLSNLARISPDNYRQIADAVSPEENCIEIDGESVPIVPENASRIRAFVRSKRTAAKSEPAPSKRLDIREIDIRQRELIRDATQLIGPTLGPNDRDHLQHVAGFALTEWTRIVNNIHQINYRG